MRTARTGRRALAAEAIRTRLVDAAAKLLAERQPATITSRDIARRAGASDGVLYNHFADKHDLLITALVSRFGDLVAGFAADPPVPGRGSVADGVADLVRRSHELQLAALPMLANLVGDPPLLHRFLVAIHRPPLGGDAFHRPIVDYLEGERRLGRIGPIEPAAVADVLVGAVLLRASSTCSGIARPPNRRTGAAGSPRPSSLRSLRSTISRPPPARPPPPTQPAPTARPAPTTKGASRDRPHAARPVDRDDRPGDPHAVALRHRAVARSWGREGRFRAEELRLARVEPGERVLDVGCGTGSLALAAARRVGPAGRVVGVDPSVEMIGRATAKARGKHLPLEFIATAGEALPFPADAFDLVTMSLVLHQLPADALHATMAQVRRVLAPGGRLLAVDLGPSVPGQRTVHSHAGRTLHDGTAGSGQRFDLDRVGMLFEHAGLTIVDRGPVDFRFRMLEPLRFLLAEAPAAS